MAEKSIIMKDFIDELEIARLCGMFEELYHAVPSMYTDSFEQGILWFQSADYLRAKEDRNECVFHEQGKKFKEEYFLFCMSRSPNIKNVRPGKRNIYQISTRKLVLAVIRYLNQLQLQVGGGLIFFTDKSPLSHKNVIAAKTSLGAVKYKTMEENDTRPACFIKSPKYQDEQEVRLAIQLLNDIRILTAKKGFIRIKINPTGCFSRIK